MQLVTTYLRLLLLSLLLAVHPAHSQERISVPSSTSGARQSIVEIPVTGTISSLGHLRLVFDYPANVIRFVRCTGGPNASFRCPQAYVGADTIVDGTRGRLTVECWDVQPTTNGLVCMLVMEFLNGPGTSGYLQPIRMDREKTPVPTVEFQSGLITADGSPAIPTPAEGFTGNYPNPFSSQSTFVFMLESAQPVHLSVCTMQGRTILDLGQMQGRAGENSYDFAANSWELAQGSYLMSLQTSTGTYLHPFMVLK